jgi:hypothetical protein
MALLAVSVWGLAPASSSIEVLARPNQAISLPGDLRWEIQNYHTVAAGTGFDQPLDLVWNIIPFGDLPQQVQEAVLREFPQCVVFDSLPDHLTSQIIVRSLIPCPTGTNTGFSNHMEDCLFIKHMEVTLPDLYMKPCTRMPYDSNSIYYLPKQPIHHHDNSNISNIDSVCMCKMCRNMPGFPNEGFAFQSISDNANYRGVNHQTVEFRITPYARFILPFVQSIGSVVTIEMPTKDVNADTTIFKRTSFHKFLEFIRKTINLDRKKIRSLRKVIARMSNPRTDGVIEIRFKRDAAGYLFLLFSNPLGSAKKSPASVVISYHDLRMVCGAWNSTMIRPNVEYLRDRQIVTGTHPYNIMQPTSRQIAHTIPPIFRPLDQLARLSCFLTTVDESRSPLHITLHYIPSAVVDIIGQYCCITNSGTPRFLVDVDGSSNPNPAYDPSSDSTTTVPVAGYGMGSFSTLFLNELYDPSLLEEISSFLFYP